MTALALFLLFLLLIMAALVFLSKNLLLSVLLYGGCGLIMTILWLLLQAPDLAMTEAAVGVGATGILYLLVLRRVGLLKRRGET